MTREIIEHIDGNFGATVIYTVDETYTCSVGFVAVEIVSPSVSSEAGVPLGRGYSRRNTVRSSNLVFDPRNAEPYLAGSVKWDGCADYTLGDPESGVMMHVCSRDDIEKVSRVLALIYERCGEIMMQENGVEVLDDFACARAAQLNG